MLKTAKPTQASLAVGEIANSSPELSAKMELLLELADVWEKELNEGQIKNWSKYLNSSPYSAIQAFFQKWQEDNERFFPKPQALLAFVRQWKTENREPFKSCGNCDDGWIYGETEKGNRCVSRCECFTAWANK